MKWPRSLRELRDVTGRFVKPRNVNYSPAPVDYGYGPHPFPGQGSFPAIPPTPPMTVFAPFGPSIPNTQGVGSHPWPANPQHPVSSASAGRSSAIATDWELQTGPIPGRIPRAFAERMAGMVGPNGGNNVGMASFDNASWAWLPHVPIVRQIYATKNYKTWDDNMPIPAVFAGNPRP